MKALIFAGMVFLLSAGSVLAEKAKQQNVPPDKPVITTWSKIKELFQ